MYLVVCLIPQTQNREQTKRGLIENNEVNTVVWEWDMENEGLDFIGGMMRSYILSAWNTWM